MYIKANTKEAKPHPEINYFEDCQRLVKKHTSLESGKILHLDKNQATLKVLLIQNGFDVPDGSKIDVYNPSIIFIHNNSKCIAGRVELSGKQAEHDSLVVFFKFENGSWVPQESPIFKLQDPNITWINGEMVLSGVELTKDEEDKNPKYRMAFYSGKDFENLNPLAKGPWDMKGIRVIQLKNGKIGVYTRPQGDKGGLGSIGFIIVDSMLDFEKYIENAPLLSTNFFPKQWGGINQIIPISETENLLIGHVAYRDSNDNRHYFSCSFKHNFITGDVSKMNILAKRSDFPDGPAKAPDLVDIVYTAGVIEIDGEWFLIVGLSDTQSGVIKIEDPNI